MVNPSGIRLPEGASLKVEVLNPGIYSIENAYEGQYEYFEDRPIEVSTEVAESPAPTSVSSESELGK
jgi:hypothetical protein